MRNEFITIPSMRHLFLLAAIFATLTYSGFVEACSPPQGPVTEQDHLDNADMVFVGEVIQAGRFKSDTGIIGVDFLVLLPLKGEEPQKVRVRTRASSAACGYDSAKTFEPDSVWMIFASEDTEGNYSTTHLAGNKKYEGMTDAAVAAESILAESLLDTAFDDIIDMSFEVVDASEPPANCARWFDGCNRCGRSEPGGMMVCTEMACMETSEPRCEEYFDDDFLPPVDMPPVMMNQCKVTFDGCNACVYDQFTDDSECTESHCDEALAESVCLLYFDEVSDLMEHGAWFETGGKPGAVDVLEEGMTPPPVFPEENLPEFGSVKIPPMTQEELQNLMEIVPGMSFEGFEVPETMPAVEDMEYPGDIDEDLQALLDIDEQPPNLWKKLMTSLIFWD